MANQQQQQHEKKKMDHFSHKHPLSLIEDDKVEMSKSDEYSKKRSFLRCYGCTEKIGCGVPYYRCEEVCPSFCLHHSCAHLPATIRRVHSLQVCDQDLQLMKRPNKGCEECTHCGKEWYRFAYVCSDCGYGVDIRCAMKGPNEAKHSFHQHPLQPFYYYRGGEVDDSQLLVCSVCSLIITPMDGGGYYYYRCNYCNFIVHPECTNLPPVFESPSHHPQHKLYLHFDYPGSKICKICQEEIDRNTQWAYFCAEMECRVLDYYIHAGYEGCLTSTISLQHFDHQHPLALVEEEAPPTLDHSIAQDCHCCRQKISSVPYYTCIHCKSYHLHKLCALLPMEIKHPLHPNCTLELLSRRKNKYCDHCEQLFKGFTYYCSSCDFDLDIECALKTQKVKKIFHKHPLFLSPTKGPYNCHACDRDNEGSSYQCTCCKFWLHEQCASLPEVKDNSSHEHQHDLHLVHDIPRKYYGVVYCRICTKALKCHRWAYHCNQCRYLIHVHDCFNPRREGEGVTIDASEVVHLPLDGEPILEEKVTNGKMTKHHRHPMILLADQLESNVVAITTAFMNLIRGSEMWPIFRANGKDYNGVTFSFYDGILTMQVTGVELPHYIKHEDHPHVLESTFLNSSTWCHACEQFFFGRGFKCTTCAFTIDTYCALLPRMIKHRYDKHGFSLTYSAIEGVEEYVCEICEKDVTPRYFYHCAACDQSIHVRCIWKAYVQFELFYKLDLGRRLVLLVPPSEELPKCIICEQKETYGHGFAFQDYNDHDRKYMVHLTCISEDDLET